MTNLDWRINYANGLIQKLEAVKKGCGGGQIHDVVKHIGLVNMNIMLVERRTTDERLQLFDEVIQETERFLAGIVVPQSGTETRRGWLSQLWRTNE